LNHRLGQLSGKPSTSTLHIHPILNNTSEFGVDDVEISTISSLQRKAIFKNSDVRNQRRYDAASWHSDIQFEPVPADYTSLRLTQLPKTGGDTVWASGYEIYDRFSPAYQKFFEGLTATFSGEGFTKAAAANPDKVKIYEKERGSPLNVGTELKAVHPVVRTNPVTGWKSIFALGPFPKFINELDAQESEELLNKFKTVITENHDLQVRFKWRNENDIGEYYAVVAKRTQANECVQLSGTTAVLSTALPSITRDWVSDSATALSVLARYPTSIPTANLEL
jgi:alpha-ketoglutarate-dependent taurine dioxygenase